MSVNASFPTDIDASTGPGGTLRLRQFRPDDVNLLAEINGDPRTFEHSPELTNPDRAAAAAQIAQIWANWDEHGFGYHAIEFTPPGGIGRFIGYAGITPDHSPGPDYAQDIAAGSVVANLGYRIHPDLTGTGLGRAAVRAVVAAAAEFLPAAIVVARTKPGNAAARAVARRAGLLRTADRDPWTVFELPRTRVEPIDSAEIAAEIVPLWQRVNAAGGAVGFFGAATDSEVAAAWQAHVAAPGTTLVTLRASARTQIGAPGPATSSAPDSEVILPSELIGIGLWTVPSFAPMRHLGTVKRLMVDPRLQGQNLGRVLLVGMFPTARELGIEQAIYEVRGGTAAERFYPSAGCIECGRIPRALYFPDGAHDSVIFRREVWSRA